MKAEFTNKDPKFNLMNPDGIRSQVHSESVSDVLLTDGQWYRIEPGSFKFYKTSGDRAVPFIQFKVPPFNGATTHDKTLVAGKTIEVFPASVVGIAYREAGDSDSENL